MLNTTQFLFLALEALLHPACPPFLGNTGPEPAKVPTEPGSLSRSTGEWNSTQEGQKSPQRLSGVYLAGVLYRSTRAFAFSPLSPRTCISCRANTSRTDWAWG